MQEEEKFWTLKEIEGAIVHDVYLKNEVQRRVDAFEYIDDLHKVTEYIGGEVIDAPKIRCDWMIKKVFFPGVECYLLYNHKDDEFPATLSVLFSGERIKDIKGEDLASLTISTINHIIRYIKKANPDKNLPEICSIV